jgi:hypothetical protein
MLEVYTSILRIPQLLDGGRNEAALTRPVTMTSALQLGIVGVFSGRFHGSVIHFDHALARDVKPSIAILQL